jgi:hypothetical protein
MPQREVVNTILLNQIALLKAGHSRGDTAKHPSV